ncbi:unnamed protein product [Paramecium sonneborni]|uniref:Uncharacterized protein n=1 Tax=Paramecium sonneborni TaxID=65129 RepID=A0A8S1NH24_9CILI|nr:unnamed protein product [Paramecium sonneborni]
MKLINAIFSFELKVNRKPIKILIFRFNFGLIIICFLFIQ